jgi:hypothetical protein
VEFYNGIGNIFKGLRLTRTDIKNTTDLRILKQPEVNRDNIIDIDEITQLPAIPLNVYGYSKWQFDQYVRSLNLSNESQVVGLRYFNVYGPREVEEQAPSWKITSISGKSVLVWILLRKSSWSQ